MMSSMYKSKTWFKYVRWRVTKEDTGLQLLVSAHTHTHMHTCTYIHKCTQGHTWMYIQTHTQHIHIHTPYMYTHKRKDSGSFVNRLYKSWRARQQNTHTHLQSNGCTPWLPEYQVHHAFPHCCCFRSPYAQDSRDRGSGLMTRLLQPHSWA